MPLLNKNNIVIFIYRIFNLTHTSIILYNENNKILYSQEIAVCDNREEKNKYSFYHISHI